MDIQTTQPADKPKPKGLLDGYISEHDLAREISYEVRTLRKWRRDRQGPPFVLIGKSIYYPEDKFRQWLASRVQAAPQRKGKGAAS
jgi:hypothetical protein